MKGSWIKFGVVGLMCLLLALVPLLGACAPKPAPPGPPVPAPPKPKVVLKIGGLVDITGRAAYHGKYFSTYTAPDFLKWFQEDPEGYGGIPGVELKWIPFDFHFEPETGRIGAKKLITEDKVIIGAPFWGSMTDALVLPLQKEYEIPNISLGALPAAIWPPTWTFQSYFGYNDQPRVYIDLMLEAWEKAKKPGKPKMALLYEDTPFGRGQIPFAKKYAEVKGVPIVADIAHPGAQLEFSAELTRIKGAGADFIYYVTALAGYPAVCKGMADLGMTIPLTTPMQSYHPQILPLAGPAANDRLFTTIRYLDWFDKDDPKLGKAVAFFRKIMTKYHPEIPDLEKHEYLGTIYIDGVGWAIMAIAARGIEMCVKDKKIAPEKLTGKELRDAIREIKDFNCYVDGWGPLISFSADDHRALKQLRIITVKGGKYVPATEFMGISIPKFVPVGKMLPEELEGKM